VGPALPRRRIPRPFDDIEHLTEDLNESNNVADVPRPSLPHQTRIQWVILMLWDTIQTASNSFGLSWLYPCWPSFEPDKFIPSGLLARTCPMAIQGTDSPLGLPNVLLLPYPFPICPFISWYPGWIQAAIGNQTPRSNISSKMFYRLMILMSRILRASRWERACNN